MSAVDKLKELSAALRGSGIEGADKESEMILSVCLDIDRGTLYRDNPALTGSQERELKSALKRRMRREPLQYIIGHVDFCGLRIAVGSGVLIPRPETELLVEEVIREVARCKIQVTSENGNSSLVTRRSSLRILDLCTGSGCIALALAKHLPQSVVVGTDISEKALEYAGENATTNSISNVAFMKGSLYEPVRGMKFDIIVSNPPYIKTPDMEKLQPEIREWEPREALDGGEDGLRFYGEILSGSRGYLKDDGFIVMELGAGELVEVATLAETLGFAPVSVGRDYSGIERILRLSRL